MKKRYNFSDKKWQKDFMYVYSPIVKSYPVFAEEENCLVNRFDEGVGDYEYISVITKEKYSNVRLSVKCDFHKYGAPLVVFTDDVRVENGNDGREHMFYGVHFEVVAWEQGCNIWYILPCPERTEHPVAPTKILAQEFKIENGAPIDMTVEVGNGTINCCINGNRFSVSHPEIPKEFHIGYTACEGINRLYEISIE